MKYKEEDVKLLVEKIKEFKAGAIDNALNKHIDQCVKRVNEEVKKRKLWGIF